MDFKIYTNIEEIYSIIMNKIPAVKRNIKVADIPEPLKTVNENIYNLEFYNDLDDHAVMNTLNYLFYYMKNGIYVRIRRNKLDAFVPFSNEDFKSLWGLLISSQLGPYRSLAEYYQDKRNYYRKENILPPERWWLNAFIIDNELSPNGVWGTHLLPETYNMLINLCRMRHIPDVEFFINKRDHPQLKADLSEPYDFISCRLLGKQIDFNRAKVTPPYKFAPIVSFFTSESFADVPFVTTDDWTAVSEINFNSDGSPNNYSGELTRQYQEKYPWENKINTCFFRGSATGGGTTPDNNQRLRAALLSHYWRSDPQFNRYNRIDGVPFLDAGITAWNVRDKKISCESPMTFIRWKDLPFRKANKVPLYEQIKYKYVLYVDGHVAAARYSYLLKMGTVIFKVDSFPSNPGKNLWFFPILKPWVDHIPVKYDLSDLAEKIAWAKTHDDECKIIAQNARTIYEQYVSLNKLFDYCQNVLFNISSLYSSQ